MDGRLVQASCRTADFASVEAALRQWNEVDAVGSFREKNNNKKDTTTVFVTFRDEASAKAATEKLEALPGIIKEGSNSDDKRNSSRQSKRKTKNLAAEFLKYESYGDKPEKSLPQKSNNSNANQRGSGARGRGGRGSRGNRGRGSDRVNRGDAAGQGGSNSVRGRGRASNSYRQPALPPFEANVAFVDNVPFGTTNSDIMERFSVYGRIIDINRLELMVMICYDNPESVQQCIQHMNGSKINQNIVTVSSGTVRIPGAVAMHLGI